MVVLISAFYAMGPVFANRIGFDLGQLSNFMASVILAAMLLAWPIGRVCDHFDRYRILLIAATMAAVSGILAAALSNFSPLTMMVFAVLCMGLCATIYPVSVAITNDLMENHQVTAACTALLLSYGLGSIVGPLVSALFMELLGASGLFVSNALALGRMILLMMVGPGRNHPEVTRQDHYYMSTPEAALGLAELDSRNTGFGETPETAKAEVPETEGGKSR